ncbi:alpha-acetolactate decarboxylase [Urechidicola croceus]|uniref:Alpha-acetolactate decarboxylase n=1 Tax=Urechidicola croceus TaxID=1850246 RepID=A0A1D8PBU8_9FLAO|nr:alpha-acetolactate decarboxylase [Urechidicola croceus]
MKNIYLVLFIIGLISCNSNTKKSNSPRKTYPDIQIVGAMKNVMWNGQLEGVIKLDTIKNKKGLYGLGPVSFLSGELLINDGKTYISKVLSDSTMSVEKNNNISAPFFVYGNVNEWLVNKLPKNIHTIKDLEFFIDQKTKEAQKPFAFKLIGKITNAQIHIQNLPKGTKVSSPKQAHQGQTNYNLYNEDVEIIGFFSYEHKGVFTHHDSLIHLHLITKDEQKMGHLDRVVFSDMKLYLPKS